MGHWRDENPRMSALAGQIGPAIMLIHMRPRIGMFLEQRGYRLTEFYLDMFGTDVDIVAYKYAVQLDKTFHIEEFALKNAEGVANYIADAFDKMTGNVKILPPSFSPFIDDDSRICIARLHVGAKEKEEEK